MQLPTDPSPLAPLQSESLGDQAESEWLRLRRQWELAEGFWLGFLFVDSYLVATQFRERLTQLIRSQVGHPLLLTAREPDDLRPSQRSPSLVDQLLAEPARAARVIWIEGLPGREDTVQPVSAWESAWGELLLRINERRERLRRELTGGLIIVASPGVRDALRDAAPDLWSIRSLVLNPRLPRMVDVSIESRLKLDESADAKHVASRSASSEEHATPSDSTDPLALLREARGLLSQDRPRSALRRAAQAVDRLTEGSMVDPFRVAEAFQVQAEAELADNDPASALKHSQTALNLLDGDLREEHLDWLRSAAKSAERCGETATALELRETSVELARRLLAHDGKSRTLTRQQMRTIGELAELQFRMGHRQVAKAGFREAFELSERIVTHFGETPESLRDLTVSLNNVGDVERAEGRREAALSAYRRGLEISARIVTHFGETPESVSDVVVSQFKMSQVDPEQAEERLRVARNAMQSLIDRDWATAEQRPWLNAIDESIAKLNESGE